MQVSWLLPSASRKPIRGWKALVSAIRETTSSIATFHPHSSMLRRTKDFWGCQTRGSSNSWPLRLQSCIQLRVRIYYISKHFWWFLNTNKCSSLRSQFCDGERKSLKVLSYSQLDSRIRRSESETFYFSQLKYDGLTSNPSLSGGHFHEKTRITKMGVCTRSIFKDNLSCIWSFDNLY